MQPQVLPKFHVSWVVDRMISKRWLVGSRCGMIAMCVLMAGCRGEAPKAASQSLASVDGNDITVHQLNQELAQVNVPANLSQQEALKKQALEALIERQLVVDAAIAAKLDRDPDVMHQLERTKAQVLAQAYMQNTVASAAKVSPAEVQAFYEKHPELFANRKLFDMRQLSVAPAFFDAALQGVVDAATSVDDVAAWLDAHNVAYRHGQGNKNTTELPPQIVGKLDALSRGKPFIIRDPSQVTVVSLKYVKDVPVSAEASVQQITNFLSREKSQEAVKAEMARLRNAAKIAYTNVQPETAASAAQPEPVASAAPAPKGDTRFDRTPVKLQ
jgi:peptidyl-prolyl cis-trans isomerase C